MRKIQVAILDKIHQFCLDNSLRYSLSGGTLLGAVRHKGYIPWDDDIDIMMPRPDYEKLVEGFKNVYPHLVVQDYHSDITFPLRWVRIYNDKTILISKTSVGGVFVDVFPVDGLPDENKTHFYLYELKKLKKQLGRTTRYHSEALQKNGLFLFFLYMIKKIIFPSRKVVIRRLDALFNSYPFDSSEYAGAIVGMFGIKEHMNAKVFKNYIMLDFEGNRYMCIKDYDAYLTKHYGDYMQLPPVEKRKTHHKFKIYWK